MKVKLIQLEAENKLRGEIIDFLQIHYPLELDFIEKIDKDWIRFNDLINGADFPRTIDKKSVWIDIQTGEIEY